MKRKRIKPKIDTVALSEVANLDRQIEPVKRKVSKQLAVPEKQKSLATNTGEILDQIYATLGGVQGSKLYWLNHEEQFRTQVEAKFLTKQVFREAATAQGEEIGKNIFMTFIQNYGLAKKETLPQVEATIVNPELEEKNE